MRSPGEGTERKEPPGVEARGKIRLFSHPNWCPSVPEEHPTLYFAVFSPRKFSQNLVAQLWYFVKCVYFGLSAYQIRCGYPTRAFKPFPSFSMSRTDTHHEPRLPSLLLNPTWRAGASLAWGSLQHSPQRTNSYPYPQPPISSCYVLETGIVPQHFQICVLGLYCL